MVIFCSATFRTQVSWAKNLGELTTFMCKDIYRHNHHNRYDCNLTIIALFVIFLKIKIITIVGYFISHAIF